MERLESSLRDSELEEDFVSLGGAMAVLSDEEDNEEGINKAAEDRLDRQTLGATHYRCCSKRDLGQGHVLVTIKYYREK